MNCDVGPLVEGGEAEPDKVRDLYPVTVREDEVDEEEEEEEEEAQDEDEVLNGDTSAVDVISDVCGRQMDVETAVDELDKEVSDIELRSIDLQSSFEPELQQISSAEPQQLPGAEPLASQTKLIEAQQLPAIQALSATPQVCCIHCVM